MLDKKINNTIDILIKKLKDNKLGSIKLSNKINTIEISNYSEKQNSYQITQNTPSTGHQNTKNDIKDEIITIDSPMVGIIYLTPKPLQKKVKKLKKVTQYV